MIRLMGQGRLPPGHVRWPGGKGGLDNDIRPPRPLKVTIRWTTVYNTDYEDPRSKAAWQARDHEAALKKRADAINAKAEEVRTRLGIITETDTADKNEEAWMMIEAGGVSSTAEAEQAEANRAAKADKAKAEEDAAAAASSSSGSKAKAEEDAAATAGSSSGSKNRHGGMPTSNSTVRKRRRGNYVYPTDESRAAKYAAKSREKEEAEREEAQAAGAGAKAEYKDDAMDDAGAIDDKTGTAARAGAKAED